MAEYMLDTDIASYIMNGKSPALLQKLQTVPTSAVCISAITKSEIMYGVEISPRQQKDRAALEFFLLHIEVLDYHRLTQRLITATFAPRSRHAGSQSDPMTRSSPPTQDFLV